MKAAEILFNGNKPRIVNSEKGKQLKRTMEEIWNFKMRCRVNFSGFWELDHSSYEGDLLDLPTVEYRRWKLILESVNSVLGNLK